jgi:ADP-ribosyl-[dinitrogen reductase] hydrolase
MYSDKIKGMVLGSMLGDALGAPHEFRSGKYVYTGRLEFCGIVPNRFHGDRMLAVGQITDDSEMSLILMRSLVKHGYYNRDDVCLEYMKWANGSPDSGGEHEQVPQPKPVGMGKNTRALFSGVKTLKGFKTRATKTFSSGVSRSNGALMRSWVLCFVPDLKAITQDTKLTNPDSICLDCSYVHNLILRHCYVISDKNKLRDLALSIAQTQDVKDIILLAMNGTIRDVSGKQKGYVLNALYCAFYALFNTSSYWEGVNTIIRFGGDTDTNASISGSILGVYYGYENMIKDPTTLNNINIMLRCTSHVTGRYKKYSIDDILDLTKNLSETMIQTTPFVV